MAIVEFAVEFVIGKLAEAFIQEIIFLHGVGDQVELMKEEFVRMQSFLKDADHVKQQIDHRARNWVRNVQDVANEFEDAIDTFVSKITPLRHGSGIFGFTIRWPERKRKEMKALHALGSDIERLKTRIRAIYDSRTIYGTESISQGQAASSAAGQSLRDGRQRISTSYFQDPDFVGFGKELESLKDRLTKGAQQRCVVSLVGMGGSGKTSLVQKAYNDATVEHHFSTRAWVSLSQKYSVRPLLQAIGKRCPGFSVDAEETDDDLRRKISESLKGRTYLIVLDDIWDYKAWDALKDAFPEETNGSRILLTTRNKRIAARADPRSKPVELPFLSKDESWELFCKKAFPGKEIPCPDDLEPTGREIVKYCGGLPLAIVVMGGLLSTKENEEWPKVLKRICWEFIEGEVRISEILSLSYHDLTYDLKPCFLYLSVFPEHSEFPANRLIQLWIAEGFVQAKGDETAEEVGEDVLKEMIQRSMIQVAERSSSRLIKSLRMHGLLRDLSLWKAKEEKFLDVHQSSVPSTCEGRRLAVHQVVVENENVDLESDSQYELFSSEQNFGEWTIGSFVRDWKTNASNASQKGQQELLFQNWNLGTRHPRSVFLFDKGGRMEQRRKFPFIRFRLLRVLDIENVTITQLPEEIGKLIHLTYLRFASAEIKSLPSAMANLRCLQTLYLRLKCADERLHIPPAVKKMLKCLRHLQLITSVTSSVALSDAFSDDPSVALWDSSSVAPSDVVHLPLVPFLSSNLLAKISRARITYEETLTLGGSEESSSVSELYIINQRFIAKSSSSAPHLVQPRRLLLSCCLDLSGKLEKLPNHLDFPSNLTKLTFYDSSLEKDPMPLLGKLENLLFLELLKYSYAGKEMTCSAQGFPQLQYLHLHFLPKLEEWRVEKGSMPCLSHLKILRCNKLKMVPEGVKHLRKLKTLKIADMPDKFMDRVEGETGEDWLKIQHIGFKELIRQQ